MQADMDLPMMMVAYTGRWVLTEVEMDDMLWKAPSAFRTLARLSNGKYNFARAMDTSDLTSTR